MNRRHKMRLCGLPISVVAVAFFVGSTCYAKRAAAKVEKDNVADVVRNVEVKLKENPKDDDLLFCLAQVHAAAYASKEAMIEIEVVDGTPRPWFGYRFTDYYVARLGLAWCMEQVGKIEEAKKLYRALIKDALPKDRKKELVEKGTVTVSTAASQRLITILQSEIDALKKQSEETEKNIPRIMI